MFRDKTTKALAALAVGCTFASFGTTATAGCPDYRDSAPQQFNGSARELYSGRNYSVVAGGNINVANCNAAYRTPERAVGYVADRPDFEFYYDGSSNYSLEIRVYSNCDTTLLINTANANWYFDDDDGGNRNPRIYLSRPSAGWYDLWIGTYNAELCDATLHIETF